MADPTCPAKKTGRPGGCRFCVIPMLEDGSGPGGYGPSNLCGQIATQSRKNKDKFLRKIRGTNAQQIDNTPEGLRQPQE